MTRIPIEIEKIKVEQRNFTIDQHPDTPKYSVVTRYLFKLAEKGNIWTKTIICDRDDLLKLREKIDTLLLQTTTAEVLNISEERSSVVDEHYQSDKLCESCSYKLTHKCVECLFVLQSPLERLLFLELTKNKISFRTQYGVNWNGKNIATAGREYGNKDYNFKEVLTVPDFYIEKRNVKLCVYTDGHTYHERTEEQALRDRNIDRTLQELGFQVLRYTGKEVKENVGKVVADIKKWIG
ncbi:MAG: DUF559 domain-containing protein [Bacteroidota bacterium]